jgi:hypothetical protein
VSLGSKMVQGGGVEVRFLELESARGGHYYNNRIYVLLIERGLCPRPLSPVLSAGLRPRFDAIFDGDVPGRMDGWLAEGLDEGFRRGVGGWGRSFCPCGPSWTP